MTRRGRDDRARSRGGEVRQARTEELEDIQAAHGLPAARRCPWSTPAASSWTSPTPSASGANTAA